MLQDASSQLHRNPLKLDFIQILASYIKKISKMSLRKERVPGGWEQGVQTYLASLKLESEWVQTGIKRDKSVLASGYFLSTALVWYKVLPCSKRCDLVTPPFPLPVQLYIETYVFKEEQELRYFSVTMRAKTCYHGNKRESWV